MKKKVGVGLAFILLLAIFWGINRWFQREFQHETNLKTAKENAEFHKKDAAAAKFREKETRKELDSAITEINRKQSDFDSFEIHMNERLAGARWRLQQVLNNPNKTELEKVTSERNYLRQDTAVKFEQIKKLKSLNADLKSLCLDEKGSLHKLLANKDEIILAQDLVIKNQDEVIVGNNKEIKKLKREGVLWKVVGAVGLFIGVAAQF